MSLLCFPVPSLHLMKTCDHALARANWWWFWRAYQSNSQLLQLYKTSNQTPTESLSLMGWLLCSQWETRLELARHFMTIVENKSSDFDEDHIIFDRYDLPHSLKEWAWQLQQWEGKLIACNISDDAVIEKIQLKQLLNSNDNKDKLSKYLVSHILETNCESEQTYVTMIKDECKLNQLNLDHLKTAEEEADTQMFLHVLDAIQRDASSICIQTPDTDVLVLALWCYKDLYPATSLLVSTGSKRWTIQLWPICDILGLQLLTALPGFQAMSGSDQTGTICGKFKASWWTALMKSDDQTVQEFSSLGTEEGLQRTRYWCTGAICVHCMYKEQISNLRERKTLVFIQHSYKYHMITKDYLWRVVNSIMQYSHEHRRILKYC